MTWTSAETLAKESPFGESGKVIVGEEFFEDSSFS